MTNIFISPHRNRHSKDAASRIREELADHFGEQHVFMDTGQLGASEPYLQDTQIKMECSNVFVAVIGPNWFGVESDGRVKIHDPFSRREISFALERGTRIIPVLINLMELPDAQQLPSDIATLGRLQALRLDTRVDFSRQMKRLIDAIAGEEPPPSREPVSKLERSDESEGHRVPKIFLSYRRDDSAGQAGRIADRLIREFGENSVFMDVDAIPLGVDFIKYLNEEVAKCDVLLAVVGKQWIDILDEHGRRRIDNANDFVRVEIAAALKRDIPTIPILLDGTKIPDPDTLPFEIKAFSVRNGLDLRHNSFHSDLGRLVAALRRLFGTASTPVQSIGLVTEDKKKPSTRLAWVLGLIAGAALLAANLQTLHDAWCSSIALFCTFKVMSYPVSVSSGGTSGSYAKDDKCREHYADACVKPSTAWRKLDVGSCRFVATSSVGRYGGGIPFEKLPKDINQRPQVGWVPKSESASEICVTAFSSTGACETLTSVEGRLEATERVSLW